VAVTTHNPAKILHQALVDATHVLEPVANPTGQWRAYINHLPDEDDVISVSDTTGVKDGRHMSGEVIVHPGFQIRIRTAEEDDGQARGRLIANWMDTVDSLAVTIGATNYTIHAISRTGDLISIGQESESRRIGFTLNGTMTITQS
jgi:hypothetical protein